MSSAIDNTKPAAGTALTTNVRANFTAAEKEINEQMRAAEDTVTGGGTVDVITANYTEDVVLAEGIVVAFLASGANTSTAPTFNPDGTGAKAIVKFSGSTLVAGDIAGNKHYCHLQYDNTNSVWVLLNPAFGIDTVRLNTQNAAYTLVIGDQNAAVHHNESTARAWTIPPNSSVAFPVGTVIELLNEGIGDITITRGVGVVLKWMSGVGTAPADADNTLDGGSVAVLYKRATDTWLVWGNGLS